MKLNRVGRKIHVWWSDHGINLTEFQGWIFDQARGESRRAVGLNPAGRQDGSAGKIGIRGGRKWG